MDNPRPEKVAVVKEVSGRFEAAEATLLTEYRGLDVGSLAELRRALRQAGGEYKIYKNTLVRLAARERNLDIEDLLLGPTALAFVGSRDDDVDADPVMVAKTLRDFGRTHPQLVIKGGLLGRDVLDAAAAMELANVAPREELLARFAGGLAAPLQQLAGLLQALPRNFAYGMQALIDKQGGAPEASPEATDSSAPTDESSAPAEAQPEES